MKFAQVGEDVYLRRKELKTDKEKNYQFETLLLYQLILFHTWSDTGLCRKSVPEICEIWGLDYDNSMRRYKLLRNKGWVKEVVVRGEKYLRPLVGVKTRNAPVLPDNETVDFTDKSNEKTVDFTVKNCKVYSKTDPKTVKSTVAFKGITEPLKRESFSDTTTTEKTDVVVVETNGHLSQFSIEECLRYVEICQSEGQDVKTPYGLANYLFESGEKDAFISAKLYPEQIKTIDDSGLPHPKDKSPISLDEKILKSHLWDFQAMEYSDEELSEFEKYYAPEAWAWLMENLKTDD